MGLPYALKHHLSMSMSMSMSMMVVVVVVVLMMLRRDAPLRHGLCRQVMGLWPEMRLWREGLAVKQVGREGGGKYIFNGFNYYITASSELPPNTSGP